MSDGPSKYGSMAKVSLQERFVSLLDSLSAVRMLSQFDLEKITERELLYRALKALLEHYDLGFCSVFLLREDILFCAVGAGLDEQFRSLQAEESQRPAESMRFQVGEGIMGIACRDGKIQYCRNCSTDEWFKPFESKSIFQGQGSLISAPISFGGKMLGALNVSHHQPDFFEPWQQHMLVLFSNILGQVLASHRLVHALDDLVQQRTSELRQALKVSESGLQNDKSPSICDDLTGLYNRHYFFTEGVPLLANALRAQQPLTMLLVDVDHLKFINDGWGHAAGDHILRLAAEELRDEVRKGDMLARLAGEGFVLLLPNTGPKGAAEFARRIQERLSGIPLEDVIDDNISLTASIGMAILEHTNGASPGDLLEQLHYEASKARDYCKQHGRNRCQLFTEELPDNEQS
jgi:diguanylate cyclase (GGDEF)-like protein